MCAKQNSKTVMPGSVFADPSIDFAFKRIFGSEQYKAATIGLLNSIIKGPKITDVEFEPTEVLGDIATAKKSVIDVLCKAEDGTSFVVEMQKAKQTYFRERMIFYTSKLIANQEGLIGKNFDYNIKPVHVVSFINFDFSDTKKGSKELNKPILRYVTRETELGTDMPGSSKYFFLNIPRFNKKLENLSDSEEIWLYLLKESKLLDNIPDELKGDPAFEAYFEASRRAVFSDKENKQYLSDMMNEWDIANSKREAVEEARAEGEAKGLAKGLAEGEAKGKAEGKAEGLAEGEAKGKAEGKAEGLAEGEAKGKEAVAMNLLKAGVPIKTIAECTGLSEAEVLNLKN